MTAMEEEECIARGIVNLYLPVLTEQYQTDCRVKFGYGDGRKDQTPLAQKLNFWIFSCYPHLNIVTRMLNFL